MSELADRLEKLEERAVVDLYGEIILSMVEIRELRTALRAQPEPSDEECPVCRVDRIAKPVPLCAKHERETARIADEVADRLRTDRAQQEPSDKMPTRLTPEEVVVMGELLLWSTQLLGHAEASVSSYRNYKSTTPYRDWFHASEYEAVACLGVRMALGLPLPSDMEDIAERVVASHRALVELETNDEAAPLPKAFLAPTGGPMSGKRSSDEATLEACAGVLKEEQGDIVQVRWAARSALVIATRLAESPEQPDAPVSEDIVERLRSFQSHPWQYITKRRELIGDAADEIERLRALPERREPDGGFEWVQVPIELMDLSRRAAERTANDTRTEEEVIADGVAFVMGSVGTPPTADSVMPNVTCPSCGDHLAARWLTQDDVAAPPTAEPVAWILEAREPADRPDVEPGDWEVEGIAHGEGGREWRDKWLADPRGQELRAIALIRAAPPPTAEPDIGKVRFDRHGDELDHRAVTEILQLRDEVKELGQLLSDARNMQQHAEWERDEALGTPPTAEPVVWIRELLDIVHKGVWADSKECHCNDLNQDHLECQYCIPMVDARVALGSLRALIRAPTAIPERASRELAMREALERADSEFDRLKDLTGLDDVALIEGVQAEIHLALVHSERP